MGISIYYSACRDSPLTPDERLAIDVAVSRLPVETLLVECSVQEGEFNGEAFCLYDTDEDTDCPTEEEDPEPTLSSHGGGAMVFFPGLWP